MAKTVYPLRRMPGVAGRVTSVVASGGQLLGSAGQVVGGGVFGRVVGLIGDSKVAGGAFSAAGVKSLVPLGSACFLEAVSNGALYVPFDLVRGIGSDTVTGAGGTPGMLNRTPALLSSGAVLGMEYLIIDGGTNDATIMAAAGSTAPAIADAVIAGLSEFTALCRGSGVVPVIRTIPARGWWPSLSAGAIVTARNAINQINERLLNGALTSKGALISNPIPYLIDVAEANGGPLGGNGSTNPITAVTYDGLHPSPSGNYWMGVADWLAISKYVTDLDRSIYSLADTYNATENTWGNVLPGAGLMVGTGGTVGTGASGQVATGATLRRTGAGSHTVVGSKGTKALKNGQTMATQNFGIDRSAGGGSASDEADLFFLVSFPAGLVGQQVRLEAGLDLTGYSGSGAPLRVSELSLTLVAQDGSFAALSTSTWGGKGTIDGSDYLYAETALTDLRLSTRPFVIPAGTANATARMRVSVNGTAAAGFLARTYAWRLKRVA